MIVRTAFIACLFLLTIPSPTFAQQPLGDESAGSVSDRYAGIVRIENSSLVPDYRTPWNAGRPSGGSGTGFLIGKNRFLTNAHVVSNSSRVLIKKISDPQPYPARIVHIAHDCDIAMLELEDPSPFEDVVPLEIGGIPSLDTAVTAVGFPIGGERISVTRGIVSRIDFLAYSHSGADFHLTIQVDAAINPGNSGGPVIQDGKIVGIAFQGYSGTVAQNVGYMIPVPVVKRFLQDVEDGRYDHYVDLALSDFALINPAQRKALQLPPKFQHQGVMVGKVNSGGPTGGAIHVGDVLLSIDGSPISSNGFIDIGGERVNMNEIVERKFAGDPITLDIWRDGVEKSIEITLKRFTPYLITANRYDKRAEYFVYAGLVFQPLDRNLMSAHSINDETVRYFFNYFVGEEIYKDYSQPVILTRVLPDAVNTHIEGYIHSVVESVNDHPIRSMADLVTAFGAAEKDDGDFITVKLLNEGRPLVLEKAALAEANARISRIYEIREDRFVSE